MKKTSDPGESRLVKRILAKIRIVWAVNKRRKIGNVVVLCPELALSDVPCRRVGVGYVRTAEPQYYFIVCVRVYGFGNCFNLFSH